MSPLHFLRSPLINNFAILPARNHQTSSNHFEWGEYIITIHHKSTTVYHNHIQNFGGRPAAPSEPSSFHLTGVGPPAPSPAPRRAQRQGPHLPGWFQFFWDSRSTPSPQNFDKPKMNIDEPSSGWTNGMSCAKTMAKVDQRPSQKEKHPAPPSENRASRTFSFPDVLTDSAVAWK